MFRMLKEPFSFLFFSILFYFVNTRLRGTYLAHKAKLAQGMPHSRPKRWLADRLPYGTRSLLRSIFAQPLFDTPAGLGPQGWGWGLVLVATNTAPLAGGPSRGPTIRSMPTAVNLCAMAPTLTK
jgi:hypothetical protein